MAIFHGNAIPSGADSETIALSSNDWDYNFERAAGQYQMSGNALGNHEEGGNLRLGSGDGAVSSLITLDGDFEISWTWTIANGSFGVHEIDEDSKRDDNQNCGMKASSTESFHYDEAGSPGKHFWYGNAQQTGTGAYTFANGSVVKIKRVGDTITVYDDDEVAHEFTQKSTEPMRLFLAHGGTPFTEVIENLFIVDSEKVQRDGCFRRTVGGASGSSISVGAGGPNDYNGSLIPISRSGSITTVKFKTDNVTTSFNSHIEVWKHDGTNPLEKIGGNSSVVNINGAGTETYTFTNKPTVVKNTFYWFIVVDDGSTGVASFVTMDDTVDGMVGGRGNSIGAIADNLDSVFQCEVVTDTSDGEPTPDWDTLLLIHSEGADGNQDFDDSSQYSGQADRQDTDSGHVHHDNQQAHFGSTSIQFDGTGDYISYPDSPDWQLGDVHTDFTIDFWIYLDGLSTDEFVIAHATSFSWSGINWYFNRNSGDNKMAFYYGNSGGTGNANLKTSTALSATTWHHVAVTKSNQHFTIYLDGNAEDTEDRTFTGTSIATPLLVGTGISATNPLNGRIEELRISKVARWDDDFTRPTAPYSS